MHTFHTHQVQQGSDAWHALRAQHYTASEAPAMLGLSPYTSRSDLLKQKAFGAEREVDAGTQQRFDLGHEAEAKARPIAERIIGEELYPVTCSTEIDGLQLLASLDGLTMDEAVIWEHKLWSNALAAQIEAKEIDPHYAVQLEQQVMITGAARALFMCSDGTEERCAWMWYTPKGTWRETILAGWKLFAEDMANYKPAEVIPAAVAAPIEDLPALTVEISGRVLSTNLTAWQDIVKARIQAISTDLQNDQDFANADRMVKFLNDGEKRLALVKAQAQSQAADIDQLFRAIDSIAAEMCAKRLELNRLVKARKETIRDEIMREGGKAFEDHVAGLNKRLGRPLMPIIKANFAEMMKGKKTVKSLRDAVDTELARCKIMANEVADRIESNLQAFATHGDHGFLFPDLDKLVLKPADDFANAVTTRVNDHKRREDAKLEAERIRLEDAAKAAAITAAQPASRPAQQIAAQVAAQAVQAPSGGQPQEPPVAATQRTRPTDDEIITALALHFRVHEAVVIGWLLHMDLATARERMVSREFA